MNELLRDVDNPVLINIKTNKKTLRKWYTMMTYVTGVEIRWADLANKREDEVAISSMKYHFFNEEVEVKKSVGNEYRCFVKNGGFGRNYLYSLKLKGNELNVNFEY